MAAGKLRILRLKGALSCRKDTLLTHRGHHTMPPTCLLRTTWAPSAARLFSTGRRKAGKCSSSSSMPSSSSNGEGSGQGGPLPLPQNPYELLLEGKRFACTECGKCCQGSGEVWANQAECAAMAKHLGLSERHFLARYTKQYSKRPGWRMLKLQANGDCIFLRNGKQCSIYGVRPMQCSTYPYWPELMDPVAWAAEGQTVCEGIEHETAAPVDFREKASVLQAATEYFNDQLLAAESAAAAGRKGKQRQG